MLKKRLYAIVAAACLLLSLSGCGVDFNAGRRPAADPNERWISDDPDMYFTWDEDRGGHCGELTVDGCTIEVLVCFTHGAGLNIFPYDPGSEYLYGPDRLFRCDCKFGRSTLKATVTSDDQNVFGGECPTITFERFGVREDGTLEPLGRPEDGVLSSFAAVRQWAPVLFFVIMRLL